MPMKTAEDKFPTGTPVIYSMHTKDEIYAKLEVLDKVNDKNEKQKKEKHALSIQKQRFLSSGELTAFDVEVDNGPSRISVSFSKQGDSSAQRHRARICLLRRRIILL